MSLFLCCKCKLEKTATEFHKGNGKTGPRSFVASYCKLCMAAYGKEHSHRYEAVRKEYRERTKNLPEVKVKQLLRVTHVDRTALDFEWVWSRLTALEFKCEITGKEFTWGPKEPTSLSIDRINPDIGYTKENVRFVCWWINAAMGNWGEEAIKKLIKEWNVNE